MPEKPYDNNQIGLKWHDRWEDATFYQAEAFMLGTPVAQEGDDLRNLQRLKELSLRERPASQKAK